MAPAPRPAETSSNISRASTIPVACIRPWAASAQLSPSVWRPNPVHFFGGRSIAFDIGEQVAARGIAIGVFAVVDELGFQSAEETLHWRIVPAVCLAAHRLDDRGGAQDVAVVAGGILAGLKWSSQHLEGGVAITRRRRRSDRSGRAPLFSPGRPVVAGRDEQRRFWAAIAAGGTSEDA